MTDINPHVSVIINSFNQAAFLEQTILSVLTQEDASMEVILVDGGSTDGSLGIIEKYQDKFAWWVSETDKGQADGINKGFKHASGEWVAWLNSDDYYLPGTLAAVEKLAAQHPDAALIYGDVLAVDGSGQPIHRLACGAYQLQDLMSFHIINQPAVFMRRSAQQKAGDLDLRYHFLLDHHLWLRVALEGPMLYCPKIWAAGRFHPDAKNIASAARFGEDAYRIEKWLADEPRYRALYEQTKRKVAAGAHRINARYLLDADQPGLALASYMKGLRQSAGIILPEWHRMIYCVFALAGFKGLKRIYYRVRQKLRDTFSSQH